MLLTEVSSDDAKKGRAACACAVQAGSFNDPASCQALKHDGRLWGCPSDTMMTWLNSTDVQLSRHSYKGIHMVLK